MEARQARTGTRREEARAQGSSAAFDVIAALNIVLGIWLIASPYLLHFDLYYGARLSNDIVGTFVILMAIGRLTVPANIRWVSWGNVVAGVWILISPFVLGFTVNTNGTVNNIVAGILIALIAATGFLRR